MLQYNLNSLCILLAAVMGGETKTGPRLSSGDIRVLVKVSSTGDLRYSPLFPTGHTGRRSHFPSDPTLLLMLPSLNYHSTSIKCSLPSKRVSLLLRALKFSLASRELQPDSALTKINYSGTSPCFSRRSFKILSSTFPLSLLLQTARAQL